MRHARHVAHMWKRIKEHRILIGESKNKRPLGKSGHTLKHNVKTSLKERGWDDVD